MLKLKKEIVMLLFLVAFLCPIVLLLNNDSGYNELNKPTFALNFLLLLTVWCVFIIMESVYMTKLYASISENKQVKNVIGLLVVHIFLSWAFGIVSILLNSLLATIVIVLFMLCTLVMVLIKSFEIKNKIWYLGIPYLLWIIYVTVLYIILFLLN